MAKMYFKSYIWLVETLQRKGRLTLKEIQNLWLQSTVNDEHKDLPARTFFNHVRSIADIFGIEILCDRRDNTYYIDKESEIGGDEIRNWMLESLSLNSLLNESVGLKDRIIFENVPSSRIYLTTVIQAIRNGNVIYVTYQSYRKPVPESLVLEPYCLREFKRRWYLYASKSGNAEPHMFALDRVLGMDIGNEKFLLPDAFSPREYFSGIYGVRVYPDMRPETVVLKADHMQAKYFCSLPLHQSQEIIEETPEYTVFRYFLTPDYDFKQDVLSFGACIEIISPDHLRKEMEEILRTLNSKYNI